MTLSPALQTTSPPVLKPVVPPTATTYGQEAGKFTLYSPPQVPFLPLFVAPVSPAQHWKGRRTYQTRLAAKYVRFVLLVFCIPQENGHPNRHFLR